MLTRRGLNQSPPLCTFHFSSLWAARYAAHDETHPLLAADFPDEDIPSYIRLIRQSGIRLYGEEASTLLPAVSDETFWHALSDGIEHYDLCAYDAFASNLLTLPRILSFACTRRILTKVQGARWGMEQFPQYANLLARAIDAYENRAQHTFSAEELADFRTFFLQQIRISLR